MMDQEKLLAELRPWLWSMARHFTDDFHKTHDLAQEGWIAAWRALQKNPEENPLAYAKQAAKWRMLRCIDDVSWTTDAGVRQRHTAIRPLPLKDEDLLWEDLVSEFDVDLAYHEGEIARAINELTPTEQRYIRLRFWQGMVKSEIKESMGYEPSWSRIKEKLKGKLSHLVGV